MLKIEKPKVVYNKVNIDYELKEKIKVIAKEITDFERKKQEEINNLIKGKKVIIVSNFNGQPFGTSKKSLKGRVFEIDSLSVQYGDIWASLTEWFNGSLKDSDFEFLI